MASCRRGNFVIGFLKIMNNRIVLPTERPEVMLRQFIPDDAEALFALIDTNRGHLSQYDDDTAQKYPDLSAVRHSIEHPANPHKTRFGIWLREILVGTVNLTPLNFEVAVLGYWISQTHTRRGFATVATRAACEYAKTLGYRRVVASVAPNNHASQRVLEKAGFAKIFGTRYYKDLVFLKGRTVR